MCKKYEIVTNVIETSNDGGEQSFHWVVQQCSWDELPPKIAEKVWVKGLLDEVIEHKYRGNNDIGFFISTRTNETPRVMSLLLSSLEYTDGRYRSDFISGWGKGFGDIVKRFSKNVKKISISDAEYEKVVELKKKHPNTSYYNLFKRVLNESFKKAS